MAFYLKNTQLSLLKRKFVSPKSLLLNGHCNHLIEQILLAIGLIQFCACNYLNLMVSSQRGKEDSQLTDYSWWNMFFPINKYVFSSRYSLSKIQPIKHGHINHFIAYGRKLIYDKAFNRNWLAIRPEVETLIQKYVDNHFKKGFIIGVFYLSSHHLANISEEIVYRIVSSIQNIDSIFIMSDSPKLLGKIKSLNKPIVQLNEKDIHFFLREARKNIASYQLGARKAIYHFICLLLMGHTDLMISPAFDLTLTMRYFYPEIPLFQLYPHYNDREMKNIK